MSDVSTVIKACDDYTKNLIFGYIRNIQQLLDIDNKNNALFTIPLNIIHICLSYYFIIEKFIDCGEQYITRSNEDKTIINPVSEWDTAYGAFEIDCNTEIGKNRIFKWTFIIHNDAATCLTIGIDETKRQWIKHNFDKGKETVNYGWNSDGRKWSSGKVFGNTSGFLTNDTVIMTLDIDQKMISWQRERDDSPPIIAKFDNIKTENIKYCIAVYLWHYGSVTLTDFAIETAK